MIYMLLNFLPRLVGGRLQLVAGQLAVCVAELHVEPLVGRLVLEADAIVDVEVAGGAARLVLRSVF